MPGYYYGEENSAYNRLISGSSLLRYSWFDNGNENRIVLADSNADEIGRYRQWKLGEAGSETTINGNNESQKKIVKITNL